MEIDAWLRDGGLIVTASDRAARALAATFHRTRRAEGLTAWPAPNIQDLQTFVRSAWEQRTRDKADPRLLLNPTQEQAIWAQIAAAGHHTATLLEGPRHRLAALAMDAHELLAAYIPRLLSSKARSAWQQDAAAFSAWLTNFDEACRANNLLSPTRLPLELIPLLESESSARPPLLLAGFDRILPVQRILFDAWGAWRQPVPTHPPAQSFYHHAPDSQAELEACALWCAQQLAANPRARLLVITQDATNRRGQIERAFLKHTGSAARPLFEFSLGVPLSQVALSKAAHLHLRWLSGPLPEHEIDWLLSTTYAANREESSALQAHMRALRRRNLQQPQWTLAAFTTAITSAHQPASPLPAPWLDRITQAQHRLADFARNPQSPLDWAGLIPHLLESVSFATFLPLSSAEFQAARRWQQAVEASGSLGFDGRRINLNEFLSVLAHALDETLFSPESSDPPILIAGPAESAGLTAHAVWFLGASEDCWPSSGSTHPLLPPEVQRAAAMPHATPQLDWELAHSITTRLLASAPEAHFSFPRQNAGAETRPSRLISQLTGSPQPLPPELTATPISPPLTVQVEDLSRVPLVAAATAVHGGASLLTFQSQCPFKAFATVRLDAQTWERAEAGLTASQRGNLLHAVLHAIWAGPPRGLRSLDDLLKLSDKKSFVFSHVQQVLQEEIHLSLRSRMPRRYLELEGQRLTALVTEWLDHEATRLPFTVSATEVASTVPIAGLTLKLRLDRIDQLNDHSLLVIDYKSGDVSPRSWELPRPDDVQLPLYAGFALDEDLGGLVFAKIRPGNQAFAGHVGDPAATLFPNLKSNTTLVKNALTAEQLIDWRAYIEQLARDFLAGHAEVDPREYPKTCERCCLQTLCRIQENQAEIEAEDGSNDDLEAADE